MSNANSSSTLVLNSLGDCEEMSKTFKKFFEGNKYLLLTASCGFNNNNKSVSILLYSFSSNVTKNYNQNTITFGVFSFSTTHTLYAIDANYLEQKLNNIIDKYCINKTHIKFNNESLDATQKEKESDSKKETSTYQLIYASKLEEGEQSLGRVIGHESQKTLKTFEKVLEFMTNYGNNLLGSFSFI